MGDQSRVWGDQRAGLERCAPQVRNGVALVMAVEGNRFRDHQVDHALVDGLVVRDDERIFASVEATDHANTAFPDSLRMRSSASMSASLRSFDHAGRSS